MKIDYPSLKALQSTKKLPWQYNDLGSNYYVFFVDGSTEYAATIYKDGQVPDGVDATQSANDLADFMANVKSGANQRMQEQLDSDNAPMSRTKVAPSGWSYFLRGADFMASTPGSLNNADENGVDLGDATMTCYDAQGVIITDPTQAALKCVKTIVDFEPKYDIYIIGGSVRMTAQPNVDVRVFVIGAPDIPANLGGSKKFVNGVNLKYIDVTGFEADGRAAKWLSYNAQFHTNKMRFVFTHPVGYQGPFLIMTETYRQ